MAKLPFGAIKSLPEERYLFSIDLGDGRDRTIAAKTYSEARKYAEETNTDEYKDRQRQIDNQTLSHFTNPLSAVLNGIADGASFGFAKNIGGAVNGIQNSLTNLGTGSIIDNYKQGYNEGVQNDKEINELAQNVYPKTYGAASILGLIAPIFATGGGSILSKGGAALARSAEAGNVLSRLGGALTTAGQIPERAAVARGLKGVAARAALAAPAGAAIGALDAAGHDEDVANGAVVGGLVGGLGSPVLDTLRPVAAGVGRVVNRIQNGSEGSVSKGAQKQFDRILKKSGKTEQDILNELSDAERLKADQLTVADILGDYGQRALSGLSRGGGEPSQRIANILTERQNGQSRRLIDAYQDALGERNTARGLADEIAKKRDLDANINYGRVREEAPNVDLTPLARDLDARLEVAHPLDKTVAPYATLQRLRRELTNAQNISEADAKKLSDSELLNALFSEDTGLSKVPISTVLNKKTDLDSLINSAERKGENNTVYELGQLKNVYKDILEKASPTFKQANDEYAWAKQAEDAINKGRKSASLRTQDVIDSYRNIPESQQAAFRAGYFDRPLKRLEDASPTANVSSQLIDETASRVYPEMLGERGNDLLRQIELEQLQNRTYNRALGGSKTADNLVDISNTNPISLARKIVTAPLHPIETLVSGLEKAGDLLNFRSDADKLALTNLLLQKPNNATTRYFMRKIDNNSLNSRDMVLLQKYINPVGQASNQRVNNE